jgi:hypothetical protein
MLFDSRQFSRPGSPCHAPARFPDHPENTANLVSAVPQDTAMCYAPLVPNVVGC